MHPHVVFWSSTITRLVLGIVPMGLFPRTASFTNLSSVDTPDPLTGHSYLHQTLHFFVGTRGITFQQKVLLPTTHSSVLRSSSVGNILLHGLTHLLPPAYGARWPPLIYPVNRIRSDRQPRCIRCYNMSSIDILLSCLDATTHAARDDAQSQRWGCRGLLPFSFQVRMC